MNKDIILEADFFLSSFFWGIGLLFLYDCIRVFRKVRHHIWAAVAAEDCLFWGVSGIFIFHMVYEKNHGVIRAFAGGGMALGMWLYLRFASRRVMHTFVGLIQKAEKELERFVRFITKPLRFVYTKIDKKINKFSSFLRKHLDAFIDKYKKQLKFFYKQYKIKRTEEKNRKRFEKEEAMKRKKVQKEGQETPVLQNRARKMGVLEKIE